MSIESEMLSSHHILCHPLFLLSPIFPSISPVFSNESALNIRWPKYWTFSISPSNEYSGLISFRIDLFDFLAVQGTQESSPTPQFESINSTINAFFLELHNIVTTCWNGQFTFLSPPLYFKIFFHCIPITWNCNRYRVNCSCLENPRDGGDWWAALYGVAQSWTQLKWLSSSSKLFNKDLLNKWMTTFYESSGMQIIVM